MIVVGDFNHFANGRFHSRDRFHLGSVGERFRGGIVGALGKFDTGAHVVDPGSDEFLFHVVVAFHAHPFEHHIFHFPVFARHLHFPAHVHHHVTAAHDRFPGGGAFRFLRLGIGIGIHPELDRVIPIAVETGEQLVVLV